MKLTEMSQYEARPGEMIEWALHPGTVAAAAEAPQDPRPPSYTQAAHVKAAAFMRTIGVQAPTWLATAFDIAGAIDVDAMESTFVQWIARHETLRSGFRLAGDELERFTLDARAVALERTVVDHFHRGEDVVAYLEDRFDVAANPLTWPNYMFVTVGRKDDFTVYLAFDHSNVDGYSMALIAHEIQELYAAAVAGRPAELGEVGSYVDFCAAERDAAEQLGPDDEAVVRWRRFVEDGGGKLPCFPLDLGVWHDEMPRQTGACEWLLDPDGADAFAAACERDGGSIAAGVLAAACIAAYELGDEPVYRSIVPFHTRSEARWATSLGWYIGLAPLEIPTAQARDFPELLRMTRAATRDVKPLAQVPFAKVCSLLDEAVRPLSVISYIDARVVPGADRWTECNAHAFGKVSYGDEVYLWINRTHDGVYLTYRYPHTDVAHANVTAFVDCMRTVLSSVAWTGTYPFTGGLAFDAAAA